VSKLAPIARVRASNPRDELPQKEVANVPTPIDLLAKRLARQTEGWSSIDLRVLTRIERNPQVALRVNTADASEEHYIEMGGKRYCDLVTSLAGKPNGHSAYYWDGTKAASVRFGRSPDGAYDKQSTIVIKRAYHNEDQGERRELPTPIMFLYVRREPTYKLLTQARQLGPREVLGRDCETFLFEKVRWWTTSDHVYCIDRQTGVPLKVEAFSDSGSRERGEPIWTWTVESLEKFGEFHVPAKSTTTGFSGSQPAYTWRHSVQSVEFNKDFPASTFWPRPAPGATVLDTIKNKFVPGENVKPRKTSLQEEPSTSSAVAPAPREAGTSHLPTFSIALGIGLVVTGCLLLWRRR
jgi:hypothetical protein